MGQQQAIRREQRASLPVKFVFKSERDVDRFIWAAHAAIKRLFPEMDVKDREGDAWLIALCLGELATNLRHGEDGRNFFPASLEMRREGRKFVAEMKEASEFYFAGIKPQTNLLAEGGRGMWLTHVYCEATGGKIDIKPEMGITLFEYVTGLPPKEVNAKAEEIARREMPVAEPINTGAA